MSFMRAEDSKKPEYLIVIPDEYEPTVRAFVEQESALKEFQSYSENSEVLLCKILAER